MFWLDPPTGCNSLPGQELHVRRYARWIPGQLELQASTMLLFSISDPNAMNVSRAAFVVSAYLAARCRLEDEQAAMEAEQALLACDEMWRNGRRYPERFGDCNADVKRIPEPLSKRVWCAAYLSAFQRVAHNDAVVVADQALSLLQNKYVSGVRTVVERYYDCRDVLGSPTPMPASEFLHTKTRNGIYDFCDFSFDPENEYPS